MCVCECVCVCVYLSSALWQGLAESVCARSLQCEPQLSLQFCLCFCACVCVCVRWRCGLCGPAGDCLFHRLSFFCFVPHVISSEAFALSRKEKSADVVQSIII